MAVTREDTDKIFAEAKARTETEQWWFNKPEYDLVARLPGRHANFWQDYAVFIMQVGSYSGASHEQEYYTQCPQ